jgi:uncharacterized protein (DUF305 family)
MSQNRGMTEMMDLGPADRELDKRYLNGMIAHHMSAIYLLEQAQEHSQRPEIKDLATSVIAADTEGIEQLYQFKRNWYGDERPVTEFTRVELGTADETFDLRLLNALIAHHEEAIAVAQEVRTKSSRTEVLSLADEVITSLSSNADQLRTWRSTWYGI